jgi:type I restriction enzyme S subunit
MEEQLIPQLKFSSFKGSNYSLVKFGSVIKDSGYGPRFNGNDYDVNGNVKTIRGTDISLNGEIKYKQVPIANLDETFIKNHILEDGDLVMITTADCGLTGVFRKQDINYIPSAYAVKISLKETASPIYFKYFFQTSVAKNQINRFVRKATVANLPGSDIPKLNINIPQLPEQQKIASFLTDVDEVITKLTKKKTLLEQYKKGVMQKIFHQELRFKDDDGNEFPKWVEKKLGEVIEFLSDYTANGSFASLKENVTYYSRVNYAVLVRTTDLEKTKFSPKRFTDKTGYDFLKKTSLFGGEIILANVGSIGKIYRVPKYNSPMTLAPNTYVLKFFSFVNEDFIFQLMKRVEFKNKLLSMVGSSTLMAINKSNLRSIKIKLPSLSEQTKIANFLSDIDIKIEALNTKIENSKTFKKGLLQQMFV